jgi:hypothetical protein
MNFSGPLLVPNYRYFVVVVRTFVRTLTDRGSIPTPARSTVLKLLASQAAIALESAHLYRDLDRLRADR